jgi:mycothiol synthase
LPWFRAEDLLVAEAPDGRLLGLHWLKRREADVGEVYNLAVHPDGQGQRLGPLLLAAGLAHLRAVGCEDVLLWVDRANDRAVRLYEGEGFTTRWDDVALEHPTPR